MAKVRGAIHFHVNIYKGLVQPTLLLVSCAFCLPSSVLWAASVPVALCVLSVFIQIHQSLFKLTVNIIKVIKIIWHSWAVLLKLVYLFWILFETGLWADIRGNVASFIFCFVDFKLVSEWTIQADQWAFKELRLGEILAHLWLMYLP